MEDSIDSVETEEEGIKLYRQLDALWSLAGMQARKWISNSPKVIAATPEEDRATQLNVSDGQGPVIKALGLSWESKDDVLSISTAEVPPDLPLTKRNVLRQIASVFDPLGLVSPFVVTAKILLQELWTRGYDWNDVILDEIGDKIMRWFQQLGSLSMVRVPRSLRRTAKVLTRMIGVMQIPVKSALFFSDSKDILWWIRGRGRDFRAFVANRVGEIQMATEPCQ